MTFIDDHLDCINDNIHDANGPIMKDAGRVLLADIGRVYQQSVTLLKAYSVDTKTLAGKLAYLHVANYLIPNYVMQKAALGNAHFLLFQNEVIKASLHMLTFEYKHLGKKSATINSEKILEAEVYISEIEELVSDINCESREAQDVALIMNIYLKGLFEYAMLLTPTLSANHNSSQLNLLNEFVNKSSGEVSDTFKVDTSQVRDMLSAILV